MSIPQLEENTEELMKLNTRGTFTAVVNLVLGLAADKVDLILGMWDKSGLLDDPEWDNVPLHCLLVALVTKTVGRMVGLDLEQTEIAVTAGLLHDIKKKSEQRRANEIIAATGVEKGAAFAQAAEEQAVWMSALSDRFDEEIRLAGLSGHTSLAYFLESDRPLHEKVFHVADDLCGDKELGVRRGDTVLMLEDRMAQLRVYYDWLVTEHPEELGGMSWIEAQEKVAASILNELAGLSGFDSGEALNRALVDLVKLGDDD